MNFTKIQRNFLLGVFSVLFFTTGYSQSACTLANYGASTVVPANAYPYFSPGTGITVTASAPGVPTLSNFSYTCSGVAYNCSNPAWWLNSAAQTITLTFSAPVTNFSVIVNGTNAGEEFYFNSVSPCPGTITLSAYCPSGQWVPINGGKDMLYTGAPASSSLITINNTNGATVYTLTHNGVGSGSRIALVDCIVPGPMIGGGAAPVITPAGPFCVTAPAVNLIAAPGGGNWSGTGITNTTAGTFNPATAGVGTHTITYANVGACAGSNTTNIVVNPSPTVVDPLDQTLCANTNTTAVNFSGPVAGTTYNWTNNTPSIGLAASGTGNIPAFSAINAGTTPVVATVTVTPTAGGCTGPVQTFTYTVNPIPTVVDPVDQSLCAGSTTTAVNFSGAIPGTTYNWTNNTTSIGLAASGSGNIPAFTAVNGSGAPVVATITVTPTINGCSGTPQTFTITVNPLPTFALAFTDPTICNGSDGTVTISGLVASTNYNITYTGTGIVGPAPMMSDGAGNIVITGLTAGTYSNFTVSLGVCTTVSPTSITLTNPNPPIVGAGVDQTICQGTSVTLTANNPDGAIISWDNGVTDGVAFVPAVGSITYTATADLAGCISTDQVVITVNAVPTVIDPVDQGLCVNTNTQAVNFTGAIPGTVYDWTNTAPSIGLPALGSGNIAAFSALNAGATPVVATITVTPTINGCVGTPESFTITVNPLPVYNLAFTDPTTCSGVDGTITISGLNASTNYEVTYTGVGVVGPNTLASDGAGNIVINGLAAGNYTNFIVTLTGCSATDNSVLTLVDPIPPVVNAGVDQTVCEGTATTLTASNPDGASISWSNGVVDGVAFNQPAGTINYTVTATLSGCVTTDNVNITVNALPTINAGLDQTACEGTMITLSGAGAGVGGAYAWDNAINNGTPFNQAVGTTTYTVTGTDANGCISTDLVNVTINALPVVSFNGDLLTGCAPLTVNFTNSSTPSGNNCQWTFGDGTGTTGCSGASYTYNTAGNYNVGLTVTTLEGCTSSVNYASYISVINQPVAAFTYTPNNAPITIDNTMVQFENESLFATDYTWDFGDGTGATVTSPNHFFPVIGNQMYTITLTATNSLGCSDVAEATITIEDQVLFFVPNAFTPDGNDINNIFLPVFTSGFDVYDYHFTMFDRWGEVLFESYNAASGWNGTYGSQGLVEDGVYIWQIEFGETMSDKRHTYRGHVTVLK